MYGMEFATENKLCDSNKLGEGRLSQTLISQNLACGETFVHLSVRERVAGGTFTLLSQSVSWCQFEVPADFTVKPS